MGRERPSLSVFPSIFLPAGVEDAPPAGKKRRACASIPCARPVLRPEASGVHLLPGHSDGHDTKSVLLSLRLEPQLILDNDFVA